MNTLAYSEGLLFEKGCLGVLGGTAGRGNFLELLKLDSHILVRNWAGQFARKFHVVVVCSEGAHEVAAEIASRRLRS